MKPYEGGCEHFESMGMVATVSMSPQTLHIRAGGENFDFEFHYYLGPTMIGKRGNPISWFPPQKSPFWDALHWWLKQGKEIDKYGNCIFKWETELVHIVKEINSRNIKILL